MPTTKTISGTYHVIFTAEVNHDQDTTTCGSAYKVGRTNTGETLWAGKVQLIEGYSDWGSVANILAIASPDLSNITPKFAQDGADTEISPAHAIYWFNN